MQAFSQGAPAAQVPQRDSAAAAPKAIVSENAPKATPDTLNPAAIPGIADSVAGGTAEDGDTGITTMATPQDSTLDRARGLQTATVPTFHPQKWKASTFDVYEINDRRLTDEIWRHSRLAGSPEEGGYQILLFKDSLQHAYLLRAGTQVSKLPDSSVALVRQKIRSGALSHGGGAGLWRNFWNPADPLEPFLWPTGLSINVGHAGTVVPRSSPLLEQHFDIVFAQRPVRWVLAEVGGHMSRYGGGLRSYLENPGSADPDFVYWGDRNIWWHAALGIPAVKWEVALSDRLFPEYYWLDPYGGEAAYKAGRNSCDRTDLSNCPPTLDPDDTTRIYRDGSVMREWSEDGNPFPRRGNLSQTLHLKAGNIHYSAHFDPEFYRGVIHRAMFEDMPAPFGQWGFGFITAEGAAHTLLRLDLVPLRGNLGKPASNAYLRLLFLRLDIAYRDVQTFHVGLSTSLLLDGRAFRPGDKP